MLLDGKEQPFPPEGEGLPELHVIHDYLVALRALLKDFAKGNLADDIKLRGSMAGSLKTLQANLLHLTWQIQQVAAGNFSCRADFMGEFSKAFNSMVVQLDSALTALKQSENELAHLNKSLHQEVELKTQAVTALQQSEASFRYMAEHDALTGVLSRHSFYERTLRGLSEAKAAAQYCGLAIFDIDRFKTFNDTLGHMSGDLAIKHIANLARSTLRPNDPVGRFGGDEFVLFLSFAEEKTGKSIMERLCKTVAGAPVATEQGMFGITISIGFVCISPCLEEYRDIDFLDMIVKIADEALYRAKNSGRNKVSVRTLSCKNFP
jgi:diguanylate cyclase (GGDEF)-like protein